MLNSKLINPESVKIQFEVMRHLIQTYGPVPHSSLPMFGQILNTLKTLAWTQEDTRSVFDWASEYFGVIKSLSHMDEFDVILVADDGELNANQLASHRRIDAFISGENPYYSMSQTPILYDPRDCTEPGVFAATILLQLAELRAAKFRPAVALSPQMQRMVTLVAAAYNGQGFVLAQMPRQISAYLTPAESPRAAPQKLGEHALYFASCLALRSRGESNAAIIAAYGASPTKPLRRKLQKACRQIDVQTEALKILQVMGSATPQTALASKHVA